MLSLALVCSLCLKIKQLERLHHVAIKYLSPPTGFQTLSGVKSREESP